MPNTMMPYILLLFWSLGFLFLWKIPRLTNRRQRDLESFALSVIIPARNEEKSLGRLLASLRDQTLKPAEIIVVDDQSDDATAQIGEKYNTRVIRSEDLPGGWVGKPWACWQGAKAAKGNIFLFLDADTFLEPEGLSKLLSTFLEQEGLLTVQPYHTMEKAYERLSAIFNIIVLAGMNAFTMFESRIRPAGAFGPCILCRKKDYFEIGGHEKVRHEILENMALGKAFVKAGRSVNCYGGRGTLSFRMYPEGIRSLVQGFSKGFGIGANAISLVGLLMIVCWIFGSVSLTRHLIQSVFLGPLNDTLVWITLDLLYAVQIYWMLFRIGNFGFLTAVLFQIPVLFFIFIFALSVLKIFLFKKAHWKGRMVNTHHRDKSTR